MLSAFIASCCMLLNIHIFIKNYVAVIFRDNVVRTEIGPFFVEKVLKVWHMKHEDRIHQPFDAQRCCRPIGTALKHPVPDRVEPSFVIFDIRTLLRSILSVRMPWCKKNYKWRLNLVWHRMLYSCTHTAMVSVKGLIQFLTSPSTLLVYGWIPFPQDCWHNQTCSINPTANKHADAWPWLLTFWPQICCPSSSYPGS